MNSNQQNTIITIISNNTEARKGQGSKLIFRAEEILEKLKGSGASISTRGGNYRTTMQGSNGEIYAVSLWKSGKVSCGCQFFRTNDQRQTVGCKHTIALCKALEPLS